MSVYIENDKISSLVNLINSWVHYGHKKCESKIQHFWEKSRVVVTMLCKEGWGSSCFKSYSKNILGVDKDSIIKQKSAYLTIKH